MKRKLLCVGGTGQMVLHYYMQLYLLGAIKDPFEAVVIDTDAIIRSLKVGQEFLGDLQYGVKESAALGAEISLIKNIPVRPPPGDDAFEALAGLRNWDNASLHPAHAFFSRDALSQDLFRGLFARPALSSVVTQRAFQVDLNNRSLLRPESDSTVVVVGSLIGGTSGGLMAPIIDTITSDRNQETIENVKIRAVFFRIYFDPDRDRIDAQRLQSNETFVLRATGEALDELHSYYIVGGPGELRVQRNPEKEKEGKNIPWPEREMHPFWKGPQAVEYLFRETTMDANPEFVDCEISNVDFPVSLSEVNRLWKTRLSLVEKLIRKRVVERISRDPWAEWVWGQRLVNIIAHFWRIAASKEGGGRRVEDFPHRVQSALESIWMGQSERAGLQSIFPVLTENQKVKPNDFRRINWPEVKEGHRNENLFTDSSNIARRAAATLLFWTLREGV